MTNQSASGIQALLKTTWKLRLETPLCIKSGSQSAFNPSGDGNKTRYGNMTYGWNKPKTGSEVEVSDLRFGLEVNNGSVNPVYTIPASGVRGSLRSWTLKHLVGKNNQRLLNESLEDKIAEVKKERPNIDEAEEKKEKNIQIQKVKELLAADKFLRLTADCFGIALGESDAGISMAGKMKLEVLPLRENSQRPDVQGNDWKSKVSGPTNAFRHITVRGPVDRITHAAREGCLHYFIEFSPGQSFDVIVRTVNPSPAHMGMIGLWEREIANGMLRVGGLISIGRGRLSIVNSEHHLYLPVSNDNNDWEFDSSDEIPIDSKEVYSGIWKCFNIPAAGIYIDKLRQSQEIT